MADTDTHIDDEALLAEVARCSSKSEAAFNQLYERYRRRCLRFFASHGIPVGEAEDVYQETMMRVARYAKSFDGSGSARAWIWQIARNCYVDHLREQRAIREREVASDDLDADLASSGFPILEPLMRPEGGTAAVTVDPETLAKELEKFQSAVQEESVALDDVYANDAIRDCVQEGVGRFKTESVGQRYIALLLHVHGWSLKEIGLALGRTESATKVFLFECRKKIAPYISQCWEMSRG